jgi:hypothetical protein
MLISASGNKIEFKSNMKEMIFEENGKKITFYKN